MYVTLVSSCEKRAWARSRAVLDSYAQRIGDRTWKTPITRDGLNELRTQLRRSASRHTRVVCFRNQGSQDLKRLWSVGDTSRWTDDGRYAVGHTARKRFNPSFMMRYCALLANLGGLSHDLGKASIGFQQKLAQAISGHSAVHDPVHHSWLSMMLLPHLAGGLGWDASWARGQTQNAIYCSVEPLLNDGPVDTLRIAQFLAGTHHRLFNPVGPGAKGEEKHSHVNAKLDFDLTKPAGILSKMLLADLTKTLTRAEALHASRELSADSMKGAAIFSRAALILADHKVSNEAYGSVGVGRGDLLANTRRSTGKAYQPLGFHIQSVAKLASQMMMDMFRFNPSGLSEQACEHILEPSPPKFEWQNQAVSAILNLREQYAGPALVFNCAQTGAGKTIANVKFACALAAGKPVRFSIALNLRSLTLQTGGSIRSDLGLGEDELATVIGDKVVERLHRGHFYEDSQEPQAYGEALELPEWTEVITKRGKASKVLLASPVLVSTIDYLINAGNPGRQGHHVGALLRVMSSDLILDEVDNYDTAAMGAVMRLVFMAGLSGRNVICSSATLPEVLVGAVAKAFVAGRRAGFGITHFMKESPDQKDVLLVHDQFEPAAVNISAIGYSEFVAKLGTLPSVSTKMAVVRPAATRKQLISSIETGILQLHGANQIELHGKRVSFGLIRVAHIKEAIELSRHLAKVMPSARIAAYHSNLFLIERHLKERKLDTWLRRKTEDHLHKDEELRGLIQSMPGDDVQLIVVATPVEEVGRDHDFDWAIIEPSSLQSIIQTAGRVNRHRKRIVCEPNIVILDHNFVWTQRPGPCFFKPGVEDSKGGSLAYRSHSVSELLHVELDEPFLLAGALRFDAALPFAADEDRIIGQRIRTAIEALDPSDGSWMCQKLYKDYSLRGFVAKTTFRYAQADSGLRFERLDPANGFVWLEAICNEAEPAKNDWLSFDRDALIEACEELGVSIEDGLSVEVSGSEHTALTWYQSFGVTTKND